MSFTYFPPLKLLSREEFKSQVFARDHHTCVFCNLPAVDAHHIIDRALFPDGGYYLDNGASVCESHHWECERTNISLEEVRAACGISVKVIPAGFDPNISYDKWLNILNLDGSRTKGPMFNRDNVQKILGDKLWKITWLEGDLNFDM